MTSSGGSKLLTNSLAEIIRTPRWDSVSSGRLRRHPALALAAGSAAPSLFTSSNTSSPVFLNPMAPPPQNVVGVVAGAFRHTCQGFAPSGSDEPGQSFGLLLTAAVLIGIGNEQELFDRVRQCNGFGKPAAEAPGAAVVTAEQAVGAQRGLETFAK